MDLITPSQTIVLASGDVIATYPIACLALANRVYFVAKNRLYFSALGDATQFEQQGIGTGFIDMSNEFAQAEPLTGIAPYQGKLAVFARRSVQIWGISADPTQFAQIQVLPNTGTMAPLSLQAIGDLDVLYLYDTGIRSLRVRDSSLNAIITDIGTPIDALIQAAMLASTTAQQAAACSTIEPTGGRYWIYFNGTIYVLSYYPSSKIAAWSTYLPTSRQKVQIKITANNHGGLSVVDGATTLFNVTEFGAITPNACAVAAVRAFQINGSPLGYHLYATTDATSNGIINIEIPVGKTLANLTITGNVPHTVIDKGLSSFVPTKFELLQGQVRSTDAVYLYSYGGSDNNTYDTSIATVLTPLYDVKSPATLKKAGGVDVALFGTWAISFGMNEQNPTSVNSAYTGNKSTFPYGRIPVQGDGYHFRFQCKTTGAEAAKLSSLIFHYIQGQEK